MSGAPACLCASAVRFALQQAAFVWDAPPPPPAPNVSSLDLFPCSRALRETLMVVQLVKKFRPLLATQSFIAVGNLRVPRR
jgi:hypothetical protein